MKKDKPITPREEVFCQAYCNLGSETFSNGLRSAIAAKYKEASAHNTASKLLKNSKIRERIHEIQKELLGKIGLTAEYVLLGILHNEQKLREAGDFKGAEGCTVDLGRTLALFSEKQIISQQTGTPPLPERTEKEKDAERLAAQAYKLHLA